MCSLYRSPRTGSEPGKRVVHPQKLTIESDAGRNETTFVTMCADTTPVSSTASARLDKWEKESGHYTNQIDYLPSAEAVEHWNSSYVVDFIRDHDVVDVYAVCRTDGGVQQKWQMRRCCSDLHHVQRSRGRLTFSESKAGPVIACPRMFIMPDLGGGGHPITFRFKRNEAVVCFIVIRKDKVSLARVHSRNTIFLRMSGLSESLQVFYRGGLVTRKLKSLNPIVNVNHICDNIDFDNAGLPDVQNKKSYSRVICPSTHRPLMNFFKTSADTQVSRVKTGYVWKHDQSTSSTLRSVTDAMFAADADLHLKSMYPNFCAESWEIHTGSSSSHYEKAGEAATTPPREEETRKRDRDQDAEMSAERPKSAPKRDLEEEEDVIVFTGEVSYAESLARRNAIGFATAIVVE